MSGFLWLRLRSSSMQYIYYAWVHSWKTTLESDQISQISSNFSEVFPYKKDQRHHIGEYLLRTYIFYSILFHLKKIVMWIVEWKLLWQANILKAQLNNFVGSSYLFCWTACWGEEAYHCMFYAVFSRVTKDKWFVRFVVTASWKKRNSFSCTSRFFFEKGTRGSRVCVLWQLSHSIWKV